MKNEDAAAFERLLARVKAAVDRELAQVLDAKVVAARAHGRDLEALAAAIQSLAMRGGKRLRAVLVGAAYEACGGARADDVALAGVAMELLQTYLLIHDDVMDGDDVRRGGPSVHAMLAEAYGTPGAGEAGALLAGDLASALAQDALLRVPCAPERVLEAARELARMQDDVVCGQLLDMRAGAASEAAVEAMHALKTASYTVRGPLLVGAALAGASREQRAGLERFARPLGVAFQLRDDLLGTFGDPKATGKPWGSDLRAGKRTALVLELEKDADARPLMTKVLGVPDAAADDVNALVERMVSSGATARVEERLSALLGEARRALGEIELSREGRAALAGAVAALGDRER